MYKYNYQYLLKSGNTQDCKYKKATVLTATFLFGQQVSPNQIKEVKERCRIKSRTRKISEGQFVTERGQLDRFIRENLGYGPAYIDPLVGKGYLRQLENVIITPLLFRTGFRLKSESLGHLPLEQMISLEALNQFVLTGKYINKEAHVAKETSQEVQLQKQQA